MPLTANKTTRETTPMNDTQRLDWIEEAHDLCAFRGRLLGHWQR